MKRVFFGLSNSMRILHYEVSKCFAGLEGCISIHNNLLVFGKNVEGHNQNMKNMLERAKKKRHYTENLQVDSLCSRNTIVWQDFHGNRNLGSLDKIQHIQKAGRPENIKEVKSAIGSRLQHQVCL